MSEPSVKNFSGLVDKSVFLSVHFGMLGNTRKVKLSEDDPMAETSSASIPTNGVLITTDADPKRLKAQKTLLESVELKAITRADMQLRVWLRNICLPYPELGVLTVPNELVNIVTARLKEHQEVIRPQLVEQFIAAYPILLQEAQKNLGSLYDSADYPSVESLKDIFTFDYNYVSFAVPEYLKETMFYDEQQAKLKAKFQLAGEEIVLVMRQTLLDLVSNLQTALEPKEDGKAKRLHATAVTKVQDFLSNFGARNITNDEELAKVVEEARALVDGVDVTTLRKDDDFKAKMLAGMDSLKGELAALVENTPTRKVRL